MTGRKSRSGGESNNEDTLKAFMGARDHIDRLAPFIHLLSRSDDPRWKVELQGRFESVLNSSNEEVVNDKYPPLGTADQPTSTTDPDLNAADFDYVHTTAGGMHSFLTRRDINDRKLHNRNHKSKLVQDVILLFLLANTGKETTLDDIAQEFVRLGIPCTSNLLSSRLHRMRKTDLLAPLDKPRRGTYTLSEDGERAATTAKGSRVVAR